MAWVLPCFLAAPTSPPPSPSSSSPSPAAKEKISSRPRRLLRLNEDGDHQLAAVDPSSSPPTPCSPHAAVQSSSLPWSPSSPAETQAAHDSSSLPSPHSPSAAVVDSSGETHAVVDSSSSPPPPSSAEMHAAVDHSSSLSPCFPETPHRPDGVLADNDKNDRRLHVQLVCEEGEKNKAAGKKKKIPSYMMPTRSFAAKVVAAAEKTTTVATSSCSNARQSLSRRLMISTLSSRSLPHPRRSNHARWTARAGEEAARGRWCGDADVGRIVPNYMLPTRSSAAKVALRRPTAACSDKMTTVAANTTRATSSSNAAKAAAFAKKPAARRRVSPDLAPSAVAKHAARRQVRTERTLLAAVAKPAARRQTQQESTSEATQMHTSTAKAVVRDREITNNIVGSKVSSQSKKLSTARKSQSKVVEYPTVFYGSQPPKTSRRTKQLTSKLHSPFKFPLNIQDCPIPPVSAAEVRDMVISDRSLKEVPLISNASLGVFTRGEDLAESFRDNEMILIEIMNFFTECIRHDERLLHPQCRGYRLFLNWTLGSLLNCEELFPGQVYDSFTTAKLLAEHLDGVDPKQIKLILWTYHHSNHFSVYCVNRANTRIDVLDSIDWSERCSSFEERNFPLGHRSIERLSEAFQKITGGQFEDFSKWQIWSREVPLQLGNDCAFFTTKFLRHYDGEVGQIRCNIDPTKASQYRAEDLSYIIFHELNETKPLPDSLEKFRPIKNQM